MVEIFIVVKYKFHTTTILYDKSDTMCETLSVLCIRGNTDKIKNRLYVVIINLLFTYFVQLNNKLKIGLWL